MHNLKKFFRNKGIYFVAFLIPWVVVLIHSFVQDTWVTGGGSILRGDTGQQYVQMFYELWDKLHNGESLFYSWHAGGGVDFYVNAAYYVISPFSLIVLALPRAWIYNTVQFIMVLKLALSSVSMVYFFCHTRHNSLKEHKRLVSLFLGLAWGLSNGMLNFLGYFNWMDAMILFPLLLLLVERMVQNKAWRLYYALLTLCMVCNFYISYHIGLFLLLWFGMQLEKDTTEKMKKFLLFIGSSLLSVISGMMVILPSFFAQPLRNSQTSDTAWGNYAKDVLNSISKVVESFFIFEPIALPAKTYPNLYFSIIAILLSLLFLFVKMDKKKKIYILSVLWFMTASLFFGFLNLIWHGFTVPNGVHNRFVNAYIFLLLFLVLQVLIHLEDICLRHIVLTGILGIVAIIITFFSLNQYQEFYVYLGTMLLCVLYVGILVLFKRKSLRYPSLLVTIAVLGVLEMMINASFALTSYDVGPFFGNEGGRQILKLTEELDMADGERISYPETYNNWGMITGQAAECGFMSYSNGNYIHFNETLGMNYSNRVNTSYNGGSPLLNLIFNIRYVVDNNAFSVSDAEEKAKFDGYSLYETKRLAGLGYMVDKAVEQWDVDDGICFEVQNSFVKQAVGGQDIFTIVKPDPVFSVGDTALEYEAGMAERGAYICNYTMKYGNSNDLCQMEFVVEEDMDLYMVGKTNVALGGSLLIDDELVLLANYKAIQRTLHIGSVKKGQKITYVVFPVSEGGVDPGTKIMLGCQFAKYSEENYEDAYDKLSENVYQIESMESDYIKGSIYAEEDGVMMTSIQAMDGFTVLVDGMETEYKVIGGCMMGIPLTAGEHTVEFIYRTPYVTAGLLLSLLGIIIFVGINWFYSGLLKRNKDKKDKKNKKQSEHVSGKKEFTIISKIKNFWINKWIYLIAFLLPWILICVHSVTRDSWLTGGGSILSGESGTIYYELCVQLWEKIHQGGSLFYTWNVGLGTDFLVQVFQYLISPFTLLIFLVPRKGIADILQFIIVLRWAVAAVTMTYYFMHTKHNRITVHKKLLSVVLASCYFLGNALLQGLSSVNYGDIFILFPIALLLEEQMAEGKGYKRFYMCLAAMLLCNFRLAVPVFLFLIPWYFLQLEGSLKEEKIRLFRALVCYLSAFFTGMLVIVPSVFMTVQGTKLYAGETVGSFAKTILLPVTDFIQRLYVCDTVNIAQEGQPMLYISVVALAVALLFFMLPVGKKQKAIVIGMLFLLVTGLCIGGVYLFWHGYIAANSNYADMSFLLSFLLIYMTMIVLQNIERLKIWNIIVVLVAGLAVFVYTFFQITVYQNFYVYLATFLLYFLILMLLIFYCRKSIKYQNMLVVFLIFCIVELLANAYVQFDMHNMYPVETSYYNRQSEILADIAQPSDGERIAGTQIMTNYGMVLDNPTLAGQLAFTNEAVQNLFAQLGMAGRQEYYEYFGGSPLLNLMFNVRYGMSQNEIAFSDVESKGENNGYTLYEMSRLAGLGFMVDTDIKEWNLDQISPFEVQNAFVKLVTGEESIFTEVRPEEFICESLLGGSRLEHELGEEEHVHDEEEENNPAMVVQFDEENQYYQYPFEKMFSGDVVEAEYESDGISDYYIYVASTKPAYYTVALGEEILYDDQLAADQRTFHIGQVEKGTKISIYANVIVDDDDLNVITLTYQLADFNEEVYDKVYEKLCRNSYQIEEFTDTGVEGTIQADDAGMMLTSIPTAMGWQVYVDDKQTSYETVGGALIGVPLSKGEHKIVFRYRTPKLAISSILTIIGLLLFVGYCIWEKKYNQVIEE